MGYPWKRVLAAEALVAVYRDEPAAADALRAVFRLGDESVASDAATVLRELLRRTAPGPLPGRLRAPHAHRVPRTARALPPLGRCDRGPRRCGWC